MSTVVLTYANIIQPNLRSYYIHFKVGIDAPNPVPKDLIDFDRERVYSDGKEVDGHYLVRIGERKSTLATQALDPERDPVIGVTSHRKNLPKKILECARVRAQDHLKGVGRNFGAPEVEERF